MFFVSPRLQKIQVGHGNWPMSGRLPFNMGPPVAQWPPSWSDIPQGKFLSSSPWSHPSFPCPVSSSAPVIYLLCCFWTLVCWVWLFDFTLFESFLSLDNQASILLPFSPDYSTKQGRKRTRKIKNNLVSNSPVIQPARLVVVPMGFRHSYWSRDIAGEPTTPQVRAIDFWFSYYSFPSGLGTFSIFLLFLLFFFFFFLDFPAICWLSPSLHKLQIKTGIRLITYWN